MEQLHYPRVTKIIDETDPPEKKRALMRWLKKMQKVHGIEGAETERQKILDNGTSVHESIERFLVDDPLPNGIHPQARPLYGFLNQIKFNSDRLIIENRLFCHKYRYQGKPDLICTYNGLPTIIDWTTSYQLKKEKYVEHKFIQAGAYAIASELELGIQIKQLVVVVIVANPNTYQVFVEPPSKWRIAFLRRLGQYNRLHGVKRK